MRDEGLSSRLTYDIEPMEFRTDASVNLGVIAAEWVTNAFKYAYPAKAGEIHVHLRRLPDDRGELNSKRLRKSRAGVHASVSLASPIFGYALGRFAGDWLAGKSVPQAMDILPYALTVSNMTQYEADIADPAKIYSDPQRRAVYLRMYGNICYDTRDRFVNFPWSSERND